MADEIQVKSVSELHSDIEQFIKTLLDNKANKALETLKDSSLPFHQQSEIILSIIQQKIPSKEEVIKYLSKCVIFQNNVYFAPETNISSEDTSLADKTFLHEVNLFNPSMLALAEKLLIGIRKFYPQGQLKKESDHHFVESPVNFWSVWSQVNKRDLAISIYGTPFNYVTPLTLTEYDRSYSKFYITNARELEEGIKLIRQALERKKEFG